MKDKNLVSISKYSIIHKITRKTVYSLIADGTLDRFTLDGKPYLRADQRPSGVKKYKGVRTRMVG